MLNTIRRQMAAVSVATVLALTTCGAAGTVAQPVTPVGEAAVMSYAGEPALASSGETVISVHTNNSTTTKTAAGVAYRTTVSVILRSAPSNQQAAVRRLAQGTAVTTTGTKRGTWLKVKAGSSTGWIQTGHLARATAAKPYAAPSTYAQHAANNIARWCSGVPVTTRKGTGGTASYSVRTSGGKRTVTERIELGVGNPVNSARAKATQYHECAHILQYRAYGYSSAALNKAMNRIYPRGGSNTFAKGASYAGGTEHMADCMADVMGATRSGRYTEEGITYTWRSGYGGNCTRAQLSYAKKVIAGQRV